MNDISLFHTTSPLIPLSFSIAGGVTADKLLRLSQRVILRLITPVGSAYGQPSFGTNFVGNLQKGLYRTSTAVETAFSITRVAILKQAAVDEFADDSTLQDIQLISVTLIGDQAELRLRVVGPSNSTAVFDVTL